MNPNHTNSPSLSPNMDHSISLPIESPSSASLWEWADLLDITFDQNNQFNFNQTDPVFTDTVHELGRVQNHEQIHTDTIHEQGRIQKHDPGRIRKRDPRLICENFLAGRVPCACPEMDAMLAEEEEEELGLPEKKRKIRAKEKAVVRCQVEECGADIRELKGYHRRHRVCLGCANAKEVVLSGVRNRYCQQCGKFHILSDFDEGKRSCRRKLERHNNRRRRKSTDPSVSVEKESEGLVLSDDLACEDEIGKDGSYLSSQITERVPLLESEEGKSSIPFFSSSPQNILSDSVLTFAASDETQIDFENDEFKSSRSSVHEDKKSGYSSVVPTGRISFKLYDWNPAEFPRRLRHQIFQWLASMPVELEGYIRPGCTILTAFIAMPSFMWLKLLQEPVVYVGDLVAGSEKMLSGRGTFLVYLDNMVFRVLRDGSSIMRIKVEERTPKLHYVRPTCFEAGKPLEFFACGSNLLQPNFRFLVSFGGKYLPYDYSVAPQHTDIEEVTTSDNQLLKIYIPHTEPDLFGPAFIEVENQSGISNFIPILIGNREICSEMKILEQRFEEPLCLQGSKLTVSSSSTDSCGVSSRQTSFSQFILDTAWLIRRPVLEDIKQTPASFASFQIGRFNHLLDVLIKNQSNVLLARVLDYIRTVVDVSSLSDELASTNIKLLGKNVARANQNLSGILKEDDVSSLQSRNLVSKATCSCETADSPSIIFSTHQDSKTVEERSTNACSSFEDRGDSVSLINEESFMYTTLMKKPSARYLSGAFAKKYLISRPLALAVASAAVCLCVCAVFIHPHEVSRIATTIRRSLFDSNKPCS